MARASTSRDPSALRRVLLLTACLLTAGLAAARPPAVAEPAGFWLGDADAPVPAGIHGGRVIGTRELQALLPRGAVVVDVARAPRKPAGLAPGAPWLPVPHPGLPGALWLPGTGDGALTPDLDHFLRDRLQRATSGNLDSPVVIYCHRHCWLSWNAAKRAIGYGYRRVFWYADGVEGWTGAGQPTVALDPQTPDGDSLRSRPSLVVLDLELTGDLGGPDFTAEHAARLATESARLREDLARRGLYTLVDAGPASGLVDRLRSQQAYLHDCNGCDLDIGRALGADLVFVAWVNRVSGLILTLTYEIHEVASGQIAARKSYDFRGDSDNAWNHAVDYLVRDLRAP